MMGIIIVLNNFNTIFITTLYLYSQEVTDVLNVFKI